MSDRRRLAAACFGVLMIPPMLARTADTPAIASAPVPDDRYPVRTTTFPSGVTGLADLTYSTVEGFRPLTLDLYLPSRGKSDSRRPLVVFVHGGAWKGGHSRQSGAFEDWPRALASLAAQGNVVSSVNYRLSGEAPFPAALFDVKNAIRWLRARAGTYGIDRQRVLIWGNSAGAQLAALVAVSCQVTALSVPTPVDDESDCVQGAIAWYGMFDFTAAPTNEVERRYLGCAGSTCENAPLASPIHHAGADAPPFLLIHGAKDRTVPAAQTEALARRLRGAGVRVDMLLLPDADHSFIGPTPADTRRDSRLAWERSAAFIAGTLHPAPR
jgi:acetyl esterase/lipase